ncbi:hypothetical protein [Brevibacillus brevis]|uniref:hypothetical protein n=1 Tax=Brevibacillus brevis TaxID=1393 RepID=UPI001900B4F6|nr:hypothetical protein [Brevibacillus brevis]
MVRQIAAIFPLIVQIVIHQIAIASQIVGVDEDQYAVDSLSSTSRSFLFYRW